MKQRILKKLAQKSAQLRSELEKQGYGNRLDECRMLQLTSEIGFLEGSLGRNRSFFSHHAFSARR